MASTWSSLKIELLETGANSGTWGTLTNVNLGDAVLGEAITGSATVDFATDADVTITLTDSATTQSARNLRLNITESSTGVGSIRNLILGSGCQIEKFYLINNTGTGAKTVKNTSGTGISVPAGKATLVYNNGTNVVDAATYFTALTLGSALPVASGGTSLATLTANNVILGNGASAPTFVAPSTSGNVLTSNGTTWSSTAPATSGTVTSVAMTVPSVLSISGSPITSSGTLALTYSGTALPVANGGTGLSSGTSGGVLAYTATGTLASSAALAASALVIGGGAGAAPSTTTTGTGVVTALGVNTGTAGAFVVNGGALGTPSSGTVTNLTGTANITVTGGASGAIAATTLTTSSTVTINGGTANGVAYLDGSKVLTTGSALTFDGTSVFAAPRVRLNNANRLDWGDQGEWIVGDNAGAMLFGVDVSEQMRLTSTGLGIGTSSPGTKLEVAGAAPTIKITANNATQAALQLTQSGVGNWLKYFRVSDSAFVEQFGGTDLLFLSTSGNLGLGVTPSAWSGVSNVFQLKGNAYVASTTHVLNHTANAFFNGTNWIYTSSNFASQTEQVSGQHRWFNAASGTAGDPITFTQAMTLDASSNLLTGGLTSYPGQADANSTANGAVALNTKRELRWNSTNASIYGGSGGGDDNLYYHTGLSHIWRVSGSEKARIDSSGNLLVGTTSGSVNIFLKDNANDIVLDVANSSSSNCYGLRVRYSAVTPNTVGYYFYRGQDSSATRFEVYSNGGIANYSANNSNLSDRREKTNFAPATSYLDKICAIPVQTFNYIDQNLEEDGGLTLGVVAQDVQAVAPELVMESNWASKDAEPKMRLSIYQTDLQYALMKCIQEQQALITQLTARITALESA